MYKFLLIEDSKTDIDSYVSTIKKMNVEAGITSYQTEVATSYKEAVEKLNNLYNGVIVDIKLGKENSGNAIIKSIIEKYRIPVVVMTGTPDIALGPDSPIKIYIKGAVQYEAIIENLVKENETGLFEVIGGKGIIEEKMNQIFWKNLYPKMKLWKDKKQEGVETEIVLLRYAIAHIQEIIDNDIPFYITEEMYIAPPICNQIKTGIIVKSKDEDMYYIVLSPPCDLAIHNGQPKSDRITVCKIDNQNDVNKEITKEIKKNSKKEKCICEAIKNNYKNYYHWLPENNLFKGGYINFRNIITYSQQEFDKNFDNPIIKIQDFFVKNILNRFSSYYARQGQPDFDFEKEAKSIRNKIDSKTTPST